MTHLVQTYGYLAVFVAPLLESMGVPFPGETVLLAASVYAATTGRLSLGPIIGCAALGAIVGDNLGYLIGRIAGRPLLLRAGRRIGVTERRLGLVERFFARRGPVAIVLARFITVLRTITALVAGASRMRYRSFLLFNALGGVGWAAGYGSLAYTLGHAAERYVATIAAVGLLAAAVLAVALGLVAVLGRRRLEPKLERWLVGPEPTADREPDGCGPR